MATTGYELVKESIFKEANEVSERLGKEPSNPKLLGAWEEKLENMFRKYLRIVTDEQLPVDYKSVENFS